MAVDPYTDPATGCLLNLLGITDPARLLVVEAALVAEAERSLYAHPELIRQTWDGGHWRAVHRYLFGDVYAWAGEYRSVDLHKEGHRFHPVARLAQGVVWCMDQLRAVATGPLLEPARLADALSAVLSDMNEAHPFREGNGRTQRSLIAQAAAQHGQSLDWSGVSPAENIAASVASLDDPGAFAPLFNRIMQAGDQSSALRRSAT